MTRLILASASKSRSDLLRDASLRFETIPADLDENIIKAKGLSVIDTALELSIAKAQRVSQDHPGTYVIGADQMMACLGVRYDKPTSQHQAREHLTILKGQTHSLYSAVAVVKDGECLWSHMEQADLTMRNFSEAFLDHYLDQVGDDVLTTVGGYRLESLGVQLFEKIKGDYFTILGLPLLALLGYLRTQGLIEE